MTKVSPESGRAQTPAPLKVAIDARLEPSTAGGVFQVTLGLIHALGQLVDRDTVYKIIVATPAQQELFRPFLAHNQHFVLVKQSFKDRVGRALRRKLTKLWSSGFNEQIETTVPISDGFIESLGCDVVHFPHQRFVLCKTPTVFNPHDLQHLHLPQFFTAIEFARREGIYRAGCHFSHTVVAASQWVKDDLINNYNLGATKVQVIPWGPPTKAYKAPSAEEVESVKSRFQLERPFTLYPAMTWPHKNHGRLLEALASLRDERDLKINLVCTGSQLQPHWSSIEKQIAELKLNDQVRFLGFVTDLELRAIYRLAQSLIMPSLFESDSSPVYEAWLEGLPIASSNVTALPIQIKEAGLLFDPYQTREIADVLMQLATDEKLREGLIAKGYERVRDYDWSRTAKAYRAVYRSAANRPLDEEDRELLSWDWMKDPSRKVETVSNGE